MKVSPRVLVIVAACALTGVEADAQFRRGVTGGYTEINLFPLVPPSVLLPAGSFDVEVKNQSTAPVRLLPRLEQSMTTRMSENDARLQAVTGAAQMQVVATITDWNHRRRKSTRFVPEVRLVGTSQAADAEGMASLAQPIYDYGRNKPNVIDEGTATVRVEVRSGDRVLANEMANVTYRSDRLVEDGTPSLTEVEDAMLDLAAQRSAGLVTVSRQPLKVLLARSDEVERLNAIAMNQWWSEWRQALQQRIPHRDARRDAYRLHNIGVAHEALAYEATSYEETRRLLQEAAGFMQQAIAARRNEKQFAEALERINASGVTQAKLYGMVTSLTETRERK